MYNDFDLDDPSTDWSTECLDDGEVTDASDEMSIDLSDLEDGPVLSTTTAPLTRRSSELLGSQTPSDTLSSGERGGSPEPPIYSFMSNLSTLSEYPPAEPLWEAGPIGSQPRDPPSRIENTVPRMETTRSMERFQRDRAEGLISRKCEDFFRQELTIWRSQTPTLDRGADTGSHSLNTVGYCLSLNEIPLWCSVYTAVPALGRPAMCMTLHESWERSFIPSLIQHFCGLTAIVDKSGSSLMTIAEQEGTSFSCSSWTGTPCSSPLREVMLAGYQGRYLLLRIYLFGNGIRMLAMRPSKEGSEKYFAVMPFDNWTSGEKDFAESLLN